ncbi:MAG: 8-oxo-dGTP diphosphatase [Paracoccaceae bacterium]|jgi:8-oxo-dGTP diphosphatase|tara:strand:- start:123 stop:557 length:435 start_codon:yes stop_codon:yes gene_type:complete
MIRRFGEPVKPDQTYRMRPGAYAVILRGDAILLTHQSSPEPEFQLPGGGIDRGEHTLPALHREVMEETGWTVQIKGRLGAFRRFTFMPEYDLWAEKLCTIYIASPGRRVGAPVEQGHMAVWMPQREAVDLLGNPGDRHFLNSLL